MKKILNCEKQAFSLAEALITLLIVCLITLATIPVLTKKRRDLSDGHKGMWICTRNSSGNYVYWDKSNPVGEKDNPDTWQLTNTDSCVFTPPVRQGRFSITMIGGGGGGGNAESLYLNKATVTDGQAATFSPAEDGYYYVEVIGGGGGRGDTVNNSELYGAASGAGGSGAGIAGNLYMLKGTTYSLKGGAAGKEGHSEYHSGCNRSSNSRDPGSSGGSSYIKAKSGGTDKITNLEAGGGGGGDSTSYNADNHAVGGSAGSAGRIISEKYLTQSKSMVALAGRAGQKGSPRNWGNPGRIPQGGASLSAALNITGDVAYGRGGDGEVAVSGIRYIADGTYTGLDPTTGIARIALIERHFGLGGKAAVPVSYYIPSIEGKVYVTIDPAAEGGKDGGRAVAVIKKNNVEGRSFIGYGASAGETNKNIEEPEQGQHSQFTMKGGGLPSPACTEPKFIPAGSGPIEIIGSKCTQVECHAVVATENDTEATGVAKLRNIYNTNINAGGVRIKPEGFIDYTHRGEKLFVSQGEIEFLNPNYTGDTSYINIMPYTKGSNFAAMTAYLRDTLKIEDYLKNKGNELPTQSEYENYFATKFPKYNPEDAYETDSSLGEFSNYTNAEEIYNDYRCFSGTADVRYLKRCVEEKEDIKTISNGYHEATRQAGVCTAEQQGGNGTSFGAGGGGGYASLTPNVASKGGKGAPGAVIIEW